MLLMWKKQLTTTVETLNKELKQWDYWFLHYWRLMSHMRPDRVNDLVTVSNNLVKNLVRQGSFEASQCLEHLTTSFTDGHINFVSGTPISTFNARGMLDTYT